MLLLRRNDILCCPVLLEFAQCVNIFICQSEDVYYIPFNEEVLMKFDGRLHSEVDTFEVCQVYRE